jgi:WD40 repeat protein
LRVNTGNEGEGTPVSQFSGHKDAIRCLQADSNYVVSGSYDSTAGVWDRIAGKRLWELSGHTDSITTLQYDTSGMLITSSFDQSFRGTTNTSFLVMMMSSELILVWGA